MAVAAGHPEWYRKAAEQGHACAQFCLGFAYTYGEGVPKDSAEAAKWYRKAAEQGHACAQFCLGFAYTYGEGVPKDSAEALKMIAAHDAEAAQKAPPQCVSPVEPPPLPDAEAGVSPPDYSQDVRLLVWWHRRSAERGDAADQEWLAEFLYLGAGGAQDYGEAVYWFRRSAEQGNVKAQFNLGVCYWNGHGVFQDRAEAVKWYRMAADQGYPNAQYGLGCASYTGDGSPENHAEAANWFRKAAMQCHATAQFNLSVLYEKGDGIGQDLVEAYKWATLAAAQNEAKAEQQCLELASEMNSDELQESLRRVEEFHRHFKPPAAPLGESYLDMLRRMANRSDIEAQEALANCCEDKVEAMQWLRRAAEQGSDLAQLKLENLEQSSALRPIETAVYVDCLVPKQVSDFVGQNRVKTRLELVITAAQIRGEAVGHVLLIGPPGLGKATLANIIAKAMGSSLKPTSGPAITKASDLAGLLTTLESGDVLFIDELHRLPRTIEEYLIPAMRDSKLDIIVDQGPNARPVRLNLPCFTIVGTVPRKDRLTANLLACFPVVESMDPYSLEELTALAGRMVNSLSIQAEEGAAERIARSSDGTPLDVLNRLRHVRDYAQVRTSTERITIDTAAEALKLLSSAEQVVETGQGRQGIPSDVRREVWRRDGGKCVKCGSREKLEYDHIIPVAKGGSNTVRNIELLCESCNRSKSHAIQ